MRTKNFARRAIPLATVCAPAIGACGPDDQKDVAPEGSSRVPRARGRGEGPVGTYEAIVVLEDAVFEDGAGRHVDQRDPIEITAVVGWLAG